MPAALVNNHTTPPGQTLPQTSLSLITVKGLHHMTLSSAVPTLISHHMWSVEMTKMRKSKIKKWPCFRRSRLSHIRLEFLCCIHTVKQDPLFPLSGYTGAGGLRVVMHFPERQMSEGSALQEMNRFLSKFSGALLRQKVQLGHEDGLRFLLVSDCY